jgi:short-subunit dehydrogenase
MHKAILITGSTKGIGYEIANSFIKEYNLHVVINARNIKKNLLKILRTIKILALSKLMLQKLLQ